jgi:DtxR family manganese transport transcriptional regulator
MTVKPQTFRRLRDAHDHETAEDYVELILELLEHDGEARLTEVARRFAVSNVTAHKIVARLERENLLKNRPYRGIELTAKGKKLAVRCRQRHLVVLGFLRELGVSEATAQIDAEGIEHHVSSETLEIFNRFLAHHPAKNHK